MKRVFVVAAAAGLALASSAYAEPNPFAKNYSVIFDQGIPIPDAVNAPGVLTSIVNVPDVGLIESLDYVWIDIAHTYVGDLTFRLDGPAGAGVVMLDRPGVPPGTFGNSDDLDAVYFFVPGGVMFPEDATVVGLVPSGAYEPVDSFNRFDNTQKFGDWTLTITDSAGGDTGVLRGWGFGVTNVPAPGALALMGLGGLVAARRRRV